jgi:repressor of nif and glnA expression
MCLLFDAYKGFGFPVTANQNCSFVKKRVDEIDEKKMVYKSTTIEGGSLGKKLRAVRFKVKFVPKKEGGCVVIWTCKYKTLHGVQIDKRKLVEEIIENSIAISKKIDLYLLSNSTLY